MNDYRLIISDVLPSLKITSISEDLSSDLNETNLIEKVIPTEISELISDLDFVTLLPPKRKLNWTYKTYDDPNSWVDSIRRTFTWIEEKAYTLKRISKIIIWTTEILIKHRGTNYHDNVISYFRGFYGGVKMIPSAYPGDEELRKHINKLLIIIHNILKENNLVGLESIYDIEQALDDNRRKLEELNEREKKIIEKELKLRQVELDNLARTVELDFLRETLIRKEEDLARKKEELIGKELKNEIKRNESNVNEDPDDLSVINMESIPDLP